MDWIWKKCEEFTLNDLQLDTVCCNSMFLSATQEGDSQVRVFAHSAVNTAERDKLKESLESIIKMTDVEGLIQVLKPPVSVADLYLFAVLEWAPVNLVRDIQARRPYQEPYPEYFLRLIIRNVLTTLSALHNAGVTYCNVSPMNIFLTGDGHVKLFLIEVNPSIFSLNAAQATTETRSDQFAPDVRDLGLTIWCMCTLQPNASCFSLNELDASMQSYSNLLQGLEKRLLRGEDCDSLLKFLSDSSDPNLTSQVAAPSPDDDEIPE